MVKRFIVMAVILIFLVAVCVGRNGNTPVSFKH